MHELIAARWSARGYDAQATIGIDDLTEILEAARWAPTWGGIQPVRFIVGRRGGATFESLADSLRRGNAWAKASAALVLVCTTADPDDVRAADYGLVDAGLATSQLILQAGALGFHAHPMAGFDTVAAATMFGVPDDRRPITMVAIGTLADPADLDPAIAERDRRPRRRLPLSEVAFSGGWGEPFPD